MRISYNTLKSAAILYASVPIIIFFIGWLNIFSAIIFTALLLICLFFFFKNTSIWDAKFKFLEISVTNIIIIAIIAFLWCFLAGQGGFVHQSSDHPYRNAIFQDLISKPWPVTYYNGESMLTYYIAHWLVPATFGKAVFAISGSTFAGYLTGQIILLLWSSLGCFIVLMLVAMITNTGKKPRVILAALMFVMFGGLDIIGITISRDVSRFHNSMDLETWAEQIPSSFFIRYHSHTSGLFQVYNQVIVSWMLSLCIINEEKIKNMALLGLLMIPFGPIPFVGAVILCLLKASIIIFNKIRKKEYIILLKDIFSTQNIFALLAISPVYLLYYSSSGIVSSLSNSSGNMNFRFSDAIAKAITNHDMPTLKTFAIWYLLAIVLEFLIYAFFISRREKKNPVLIGVTITLMIIPFFQLGNSADFVMRATVPGIVYINIMFIRFVLSEIPDLGKCGKSYSFIKSKPLLVAAIIAYLIGTVAPSTEFRREYIGTLQNKYNPRETYYIHESLESFGGEKRNFMSKYYQESPFYKLLCKKVDK